MRVGKFVARKYFLGKKFVVRRTCVLKQSICCQGSKRFFAVAADQAAGRIVEGKMTRLPGKSFIYLLEKAAWQVDRKDADRLLGIEVVDDTDKRHHFADV